MLENELQTAIAIAEEAGRLILSIPVTELHVDSKTGGEPVTFADKKANQFLVERLSTLFPDDGVVAEESAVEERWRFTERTWFIDPIDGTKGFIRGFPDFSVMIGMAVKGIPSLGVIYAPRLGRLYYGERGNGSFRRDANGVASMHVSDKDRISDLSFAVSRTSRPAAITDVKASLGIQTEYPHGSVGLKMSLIAEGTMDLYVQPKGYTKLWDTCAPEAILREAGGVITDLWGDPISYGGPHIGNLRGLVASNGKVHGHIIEMLKPLIASGRIPC